MSRSPASILFDVDGNPLSVVFEGSVYKLEILGKLQEGSALVGKVQLRNPGDTVDLGDSVNPLRIDPTGATTQPVSLATVPLPSGAATEATLAALEATDFATNTALTALGAEVLAIGAALDSVKDVDGIKRIADPLPAGSNVIGGVTQSGTWTVTGAGGTFPVTDNGGSLTVDSTQLPAALVDGRLDANTGAWLGSTDPTVGQKTMASSLPVVLASDQSAIPASQSGTWTVQPGNTANTTAWLVTGAGGSFPVTDSGGSLTVDSPQLPAALVSGRLDSNVGAWLGSATPTVGQKTMSASLPVTLASDQPAVQTQNVPAASSTTSSVAGSATTVTILAANGGRRGATVFNDSTAALYLKLGSGASTSDFTVNMAENGYFEVPFNYTGILTGVWASATGNARVTELTA